MGWNLIGYILLVVDCLEYFYIVMILFNNLRQFLFVVIYCITKAYYSTISSEQLQ